MTASGPARILIIDDEAPLIAALQLILSTEYQVTPAYTGAEGVQLALTGDYDAILCDICMPDLNGLDVYTQLQRRSPGMERRLPTLSSERAFRRQSSSGWLSKPFTVDEARAAIACVLAAHDAVPFDVDDGAPTRRFKALPIANEVFFQAAEAMALEPDLAREALMSTLRKRRVDPKTLTLVQILASVQDLSVYLRTRLPADATRDALIGLRAYVAERNGELARHTHAATVEPMRRVLIVDDDAETRAALAEVLEARGYPVGAACEGREAMSILRGQLGREPLPGVIVCDLRMPVMDGLSFWHQLRQHPVLATIPVIIMSGHRYELNQLDERVTSLAKPVDVNRLFAAIDTATATAAAGRAG